MHMRRRQNSGMRSSLLCCLHNQCPLVTRCYSVTSTKLNEITKISYMDCIVIIAMERMLCNIIIRKKILLNETSDVEILWTNLKRTKDRNYLPNITFLETAGHDQNLIISKSWCTIRVLCRGKVGGKGGNPPPPPPTRDEASYM